MIALLTGMMLSVPTGTASAPEAREEVEIVNIVEIVEIEEKEPTIEELVRRYDWPAHEALAIMDCESGGDPTAHNLNHKTRDDSWGLYQINRYGSLKNRPSAEWLKVPENNIEYAYKMWQRRGWLDWLNCARKKGLL